MSITAREAYETLELPSGADVDSIRTSFKRLATKWHPQNHDQSQESGLKFKKIATAYNRLTSDATYVFLTMEDANELFRRVLNPSYNNGYGSSDDDDEDDYDYDDDDDDDDDEIDYVNLLSKFDKRSPRNSREEYRNITLSPEEIEKNANELITEEEKEKRKAEKRRAKKKRQREKKRSEKQAEQKKEEDGNKKKKVKEVDGEKKSKKEKKPAEDAGSEQEFDASAAFFKEVVNKKKKGFSSQDTAPAKSRPKERILNGTEESVEDIDPVVLRSRQLAVRGNQMANGGHYQAAIDLFTDAIRLDTQDFRFFGNRSYCYDRLQQYEKALKDAEKAVSLAPEWPKGYFRKGRALAGLKLFADSEKSFMEVLKLDRQCEDAIQELLRVRTHQLTEMGFSRQQAEHAIRQYTTVQQALDSLLAGVVAENSLASEVYQSDDDEPSSAPLHSTTAHIPTVFSTGGATSSAHSSSSTSPLHHPMLNPAIARPNDRKMDSHNPDGLTALWVGNILPEVSEKRLRDMFNKYGLVSSIRLLPEKFCAFINFKTKEDAGKAMKALQGYPCAGQKLLIRFPDNPVTNGNVVMHRTTVPPLINSTTIKSHDTKLASVINEDDRKSGPVNGNECYFWRTTGCVFGKSCHFKHVPNHGGIDIKTWHST